MGSLMKYIYEKSSFIFFGIVLIIILIVRIFFLLTLQTHATLWMFQYYFDYFFGPFINLCCYYHAPANVEKIFLNKYAYIFWYILVYFNSLENTLSTKFDARLKPVFRKGSPLFQFLKMDLGLSLLFRCIHLNTHTGNNSINIWGTLNTNNGSYIHIWRWHLCLLLLNAKLLQRITLQFGPVLASPFQ